MGSLLQDVTLACRRLRLAPVFTLFAVLSLGLGIGVTTVVYSGVRTLLWRPLGVPHAEELVGVRNVRAYPAASWLDFNDLARQQTTFRAIAAVLPMSIAVGAGDGSQTIVAEAVSANYFAVAGVRPRLGRLLDAVDESRAARVVVVAESFWTTNLHGDPSAVGRPIKVGGESFELVGVVAGPFHGLQPIYPHSAWLPVTAIPGGAIAFRTPRLLADRRGALAFEVWGRLRSPGDFGRASAEVALIGRRLEQAYPSDARGSARVWHLQADAATPPDNETRDTVGLMILVGVAAVLLIACSNLANLSLAKGTSRAQETAVRTALGASRWRLVREQLIESMLIVITGGTLGLLIMLETVRYWAIDLPFVPGITMHFPEMDGSVFTCAGAAMALAVFVFGLWPALQSTRSDVRSALGAGIGATVPKWRLHRDIIAWQVCGSVALLLVALLCVKVIASYGSKTSRVGHGDLSIATVDFALNGKNEDEMRAMTGTILNNVRASGRLSNVAAANGLPFGWLTFRERSIVTSEEHVADAAKTIAPTIIAATPAFVTTTGVKLLRGRALTDLDDAAAPAIAVINEAAARELFHSTDAIGRVLYVAAPPGSGSPPATSGIAGRPHTPPPIAVTVVGVCSDEVPFFSNGKPDSILFVPFAQRYVRYAPITFVGQSDAPSLGVASMRSSIRRVDPDLAISIAGTGSVLLDGPLVIVRIIIAMTATLGSLALVLSMAGLFGVLSHLVSKRTREIGIRLAMGAERRDIFGLVLRDGLRPVGKGLALGLFIGIAARIAVKAWVVTDVAVVDPLPLLVLPIPFAIAACLASYVPAARAARVDPNVALRDL